MQVRIIELQADFGNALNYVCTCANMLKPSDFFGHTHLFNITAQAASRHVASSSADAKGVVFTRWGSYFCPPDATKLYDGIMARAKFNDKGGGVNFLCMHRDPQYPVGYSDGSQTKSNYLYGVKYSNADGVLEKNAHGDAACVVCQHHVAGSVYVQWGRVECSNGHITQYSGLVMSSRTMYYKAESICVDLERALHSTSVKNTNAGTRLCTTEFVSNKQVSNDQGYTDNREVACAVCAPAELPRAPECENIPGWTDLYGDGCSTPFYSTACMPEDTVAHANKAGVAAKDACCACGGGTRKEKAPLPPPGMCPGQKHKWCAKATPSEGVFSCHMNTQQHTM